AGPPPLSPPAGLRRAVGPAGVSPVARPVRLPVPNQPQPHPASFVARRRHATALPPSPRSQDERWATRRRIACQRRTASPRWRGPVLGARLVYLRAFRRRRARRPAIDRFPALAGRQPWRLT